MGTTARTGDLFSIPLSGTSSGVGVVAGKWKSELYLVVFKEKFEGAAELEGVQPAYLTPLFASSSLDAKIFHGHWPLIQRDTDVSIVAQPIYKVEEPTGVFAESFDRKVRTAISSDIAQALSYRKGVAPVRFENALKAYHGIGQWDPVFEELGYENVLRSHEALAMGSR